MGEQKEAINSIPTKSKIPYEKRQQKIYNQVRIYKKKKINTNKACKNRVKNISCLIQLLLKGDGHFQNWTERREGPKGSPRLEKLKEGEITNKRKRRIDAFLPKTLYNLLISVGHTLT